jgi:GNAT superfamily N-acetyltransferase
MASDVVLDSASAADSPAVRTVLARAYRANPLIAWVLPDPSTREEACAAWLGPSVDRYLAVGRVHVARSGGVVVGVAAWQGRAVGRRLVEAGIAAAGDAGTYLATTDPRNLPSYERLGYGPVGAVRLADDGPLLTVLQRAPRTT